MSTTGRSRSPYAGLLLALIAVLLMALAALTALLWSGVRLSCAGDQPTEVTVTLPVSAVAASTTAAPTTSTTAAPTTTTTPAPIPPLAFDEAMAMGHLKALAQDIGPRKSGTEAEAAALDYASAYLQGLGYDVLTTQVSLPGGLYSRNVSAVKRGTSDSLVVVGAHADTKAGAPGGNDNASGVAVVLELARALRDADTAATIEFVVFGAEEMTDSDPDHHHYGSRQFLQGLTSQERDLLVGMVSVDMVGYGSEFTVRTMDRGPRLLRDMIKAYSNEYGLPARYLRDTGSSGMSDHEPFELAGYAAVWLEWRQDPYYHTARDTYAHCRPALVRRTGEMLLGFLYALTESDLESLAAARSL